MINQLNQATASHKTESFAQLFEASLQVTDLRPGSLVSATVVEIKPDWVVVNAGLKSDAVIPAHEFENEEIAVGDTIEAVIENLENGFGETRLSHEKAKRAKIWNKLEQFHQKDELVVGRIIERVKGGFTVDLGQIRAFLPGSLADVKPLRDPGSLEGKELEFKIIKMDRRRNNIVVSRRAAMEAESHQDKQARLEELVEGQEVAGIVKNIAEYGAFIDLNGVDGLLHVTDISWKRVKHPSEVMSVGDEVKVKILRIDRDKNRVSLGMKQLGEDPWVDIERRYASQTRHVGKVTNITEYGCFVELEEGVEGLVHMSEMDWTNKNIHPSRVVQANQEVEVMVLDVDSDRRRISLGLKQCRTNPWQAFSEKYKKGDKITGKIRSITDFGIFVGLEGDIDGLIHLSDLSWNEPGDVAVRTYQKGDDIEVMILMIDPERERISLGVKQLLKDPFNDFVQTLDKDAVIKVTVSEVDAKQVIVTLAPEVTATLKASDYGFDRVEDLNTVAKVGDEFDVKIINIDRKGRSIQVSRKLVETERSGGAALRKASNIPTKTTLGDLLKEQMNNQDGGK